MIQRIALLLGGIAVVAVALVGTGLAPGSIPASLAATATQTPAGAVPMAAAPEPTTQIDTVYIRPAPTPRTVRVVKVAPTRPPIVVQRVAGPARGESDSESGSDD